MNRLLIFFLFLMIVACKSRQNGKDDTPIATVYDKNLSLLEIKNIVPKGLSSTDSANIVKDHIDKWVRKQLLIHKAEQYLSQDEKNVEQQIDDYRSSLLIFKYEQNFIKQKLDTVVSENTIEEYYSNHSSNFILNGPLIKGLFIQILKKSPDLSKIRKIYRSDKQDDIKDLERYCYNNAYKWEYFDDNWIYFNRIFNYLPETYARPENILQNRKYYESEDSAYCYLLKISDFKLAGQVTPLELIKEDIRSILLNKKKIQLIHELESDIYNDAANHGYFKLY